MTAMRQTDLEDFTGELGRGLRALRRDTGYSRKRVPARPSHRWRSFKEISIRELSACTGIGRNRLHAIEAGKTEPSCREIALIVSALGGDDARLPCHHRSRMDGLLCKPICHRVVTDIVGRQILARKRASAG